MNYWNQVQSLPEFKTVVESLYKCKIKCVYKIETVIFVQNKEVAGTEDSHFISQTNPAVLYVTHNAPHFSPELLLRQLAADIIKFLNPFLEFKVFCRLCTHLYKNYCFMIPQLS